MQRNKNFKNIKSFYERMIQFFHYENPSFENVYLAITGNNIKKAKRLEWRFFIVLQLLAILVIPFAVIILAVFLPNTGYNFYTGDITGGIFFFYFICSILVFVNIYWTRITEKYQPGLGWAEGHLERIFYCFLPKIFLAFVLGLLGANWFVISPLFILAEIELIITFPTYKRWKTWLNDLENLD
jgi:hypothetical protein